MKNPLENLINLIAPHRCALCRRESTLLCSECADISLISPPSRCYRCHVATRQSRVCPACSRKSDLSHVWIATEYETIAKKLVYKLKFDRANAAAEALARQIDEHLPILPSSIVVTHLPTANRRVRVRGYDQAKLIAQALAKRRGWEYHELLRRVGSSRQVGSSRKVRLHQLKGAFQPVKADKIYDAHILLIDDVLTTGASVEAASRALKNSGAQIIDAVVFTQPMD